MGLLSNIRERFFFDERYYLARYPEAAAEGAWNHYRRFGRHAGLFINRKEEGRVFDGDAYLRANPDVAKAGVDPFRHYLSCGISEGRSPYYRNDLSGMTKLSIQRFVDLPEEPCAFEPSPSPRIAVHAHVGDIGRLCGLVEKLGSIPYAFDLFVSVTSEESAEACRPVFEGLKHASSMKIELVEDRGGDIAPMFCTFGELISGYSYVCHVHTRECGAEPAGIREFFVQDYLLEGILGSEDRVRRIFELLSHEETGLVFPEPSYATGLDFIRKSWFGRFGSKDAWQSRAGVPINCLGEYTLFPAGRMFWGRVESLAPLFRAGLKAEDFPCGELPPKRGGFTNAMERFIGYAPVLGGFVNAVIRNPYDRDFGTGSCLEAQEEFARRIFDPEWYRTWYADIGKSGIDPLTHYLSHGLYEDRSPCGIVPEEFISSLMKQRGYSPENSELDPVYYLRTYVDALKAFAFRGVVPERHYALLGRSLGFCPNGMAYAKAAEAGTASADRSYSIIIPVYNSEKYLANCLRSAYAQTARHVEVVIVNDGSPDNSSEIIEEFRARYPERTKVVIHEVNRGLARTHKDGIAAASGDYFTILDGDDWLAPNFCEKMGAAAEAYGAECVCCGWTRPSEYSEPAPDEAPLMDVRVLEGEAVLPAVVYWEGYPNIHYGLNRKLYRTDSWRAADPVRCSEDILYFEDSCVTLEYFEHCRKVVVMRNRLYHWFDNQDSVGNKKISEKYVRDVFEVVRSQLRLQKGTGQQQALYERNVRNIFQIELVNRLKSLLMSSDPDDMENVRSVIEDFARRFDESPECFTEKQQSSLISVMTSLYFQASKDMPHRDYVLFVDPVGIDNLRSFFLDYWKEHTDIPFDYVACTRDCPLAERLEKIRKGCECACVAATGGWALRDFHTSRPIIQLWHGMGALKKVVPFAKALKPIYGLSSSEAVRDVYAELYGVEPEKVLSLGSIMADAYLDVNQVEQARKRFYEYLPGIRGRKVYLWAPTFRGKAPNIRIAHDLDFGAVSALLAEDEVLLVKYHPAIREYSGEDAADRQAYSNVVDITEYGNIYDAICACDVFSTDFSSSLHYAMLLDRPVGFLVTDEEELVANGQLLIDYSNLPGPKCTTTDPSAVIEMFRSARSDTAEYAAFKKFHIGGCDGHSREKIAALIAGAYGEIMAE